MFKFFMFSIFIGFLLNFIIYLYCQDKFMIKNLICLKALDNKRFSFLIITINCIAYLISYNVIININYCYISCFLFSILICLNIIEVKTNKLPNSICLLIVFLSIFAIKNTCNDFTYHIIGLFIISVPYALISLLINTVDKSNIKLFAIIGLFLGSLHIIVSICVCFIFIGIELILKYLNKLKNPIPLLFYMSISIFISILYGDKILDWYFIRVFLI